jgi:tetratricopeptide (TPR) repeat protein
MKYFILFFLISCSHNLPRLVISDSKLDVLAKETFARAVTKMDGQRSPSSIDNGAEFDPQTVSQCYSDSSEEVNQALSNKLDKNKDNFWYWNSISTCYRLSGYFDQALFYLNLSQPLAKTSYEKASFLNNKAIILASNNLNPAAVDLFQQAIATHSKLLTPHYNLAMIYLSFGLTQAANQELSFLMKSNPTDPSLHKWNAFSALLDKDYKKADISFTYYFSHLSTDTEAALLWAYTKNKIDKNFNVSEILNKHLKSPDSSQKQFANLLSKN